VQAALAAGIAGDGAKRTQLLADALAADPECAPARWHSGYVRIADQWVRVDDVPRHARDNQDLAAYRTKRDALVDTADNHRELARFCHKRGLLEEERVHWAHVLEFNPQDAEALKALGLELYEGRLMTRKQIAAEKVAAGKRREAMRAWQPKLVKLRREIESGIPKKIDQATTALKQIDDPEAIPALETIFAIDGESERVILTNRALIQTIGPMQDPRATEVLLRRAVGATNEQVRDEAIDELKKRPMHAYVPQLIAALPGSIKTKFHVYLLPDGTVMHEHEVLLEGRQANVSLVYDSAVHPTDLDMAIRGRLTARTVNQFLASAAAIETQARASEQQMSSLRARVQYALARTTGFDRVHEPEQWQARYNEYYGLYAPQSEKPTYGVIQRGKAVAALNFPVGKGACFSCFTAGTPVLTLFGPRPIEQVQLGDRVLSQDALTGELSYKPVHATTVRPPIALLAIHLPGQSLEVTPGHPFWVEGQGWRLARDLASGDRLRAITGPIEIVSIDTAQSREAYNLVVSESHTYFVGDARLLVHDNVPVGEASGPVTGQAASAP
jgi:hypothetical protein